MANMDIHIERLREYAIKHFRLGDYSIHGISHWDRVAKNADALLTSDVDELVVKAFAYIHDVERINESDDWQHGSRAVLLVDEIRSSMLGFLNDQEIDQLKEACIH